MVHPGTEAVLEESPQEAARRNRGKAIVLLLITALTLSTSGLMIKLIDLNPMAIAGWRSAVAALMMFAVMRSRIHFTWTLPQIAGALAYAAAMTSFVLATKMTTAANAILLQYTAPVYTALLGTWLLKERTSRFDWGIIALVLGGMALFFLDEISFGALWGNIIAIGSGIAYSLLFLCMRMQKDGSPVETVLLGNLFTVVVCMPFMVQSSPAAADWAGLVFLGIFQLGISFFFYAAAIKHVTALDSVLILSIEPLINPLWVFLVVGEAPGSWALVGGAVVLISVTARNLVLSKRKSYREPAEIGAPGSL